MFREVENQRVPCVGSPLCKCENIRGVDIEAFLETEKIAAGVFLLLNAWRGHVIEAYWQSCRDQHQQKLLMYPVDRQKKSRPRGLLL
jgi:hypothetical protein